MSQNQNKRTLRTIGLVVAVTLLTKILGIVREARLSTGAIYSRFRSKNDLLRAAVIRSTAARAADWAWREKAARRSSLW